MKSAIIIMAALFCQPLQAQTNEYRMILVTNWFYPKPGWRLVDGQIYNPGHSRKWEAVGGDIVAVLDNKVVVQKVTRIPAAYGRNEFGQRVVTATAKIPDLKFVLQNYPTKNAAVGEGVWTSAMQIGTTNYNGDVLELWDCGTRATNKYPVVQLVRVKIDNGSKK